MRTSSILALALVAAPLAAQDSEFGQPVATTLTTIRAEPVAFRGVKVEFTVQFASLGRLGNPFFTRFTPAEYVSCYVWGDEQEIWQQPTYNDMCGTLFYSKLGPKLSSVYELRLYDRIRITGIVRNTFQDLPWIEVVDFVPVAGKLDTAILAHLFRGEKLMAERRWQRAIAELSTVGVGSLPEAAQRALHKDLGTSYLRIGEQVQAISHLQAAASLCKEPDLEIERLLAGATTQPGKELDRAVDNSVRDAERPMWEAFDNEKAHTAKTAH